MAPYGDPISSYMEVEASWHPSAWTPDGHIGCLDPLRMVQKVIILWAYPRPDDPYPVISPRDGTHLRGLRQVR